MPRKNREVNSEKPNQENSEIKPPIQETPEELLATSEQIKGLKKRVDEAKEEDNKNPEKISQLKKEIEKEIDKKPISPWEAGRKDSQEIGSFVRKTQSETVLSALSRGEKNLGLGSEVERHNKEFYPEKLVEINADAKVWAENILDDPDNYQSYIEHLKGAGKDREIKTIETLVAKKDFSTVKELLGHYYIIDRTEKMQEEVKRSIREDEKASNGEDNEPHYSYRDITPNEESEKTAEEGTPKRKNWFKRFFGI